MTATGSFSALAIDAGQTGMKVRVHRDGARVLDRVMPGVRTHEPLLPQLAAVARTVADETGDSFEVISTGVSGLTSRESDAAALMALLTDLGARRVILAHDSVTSFLGTLGDARGAVVAAGTGVVTLAVGRSAVARVDGWGNIMGDIGSGYWIGREGLDAAMRAYDGRGDETALLDMLRERWPDPASAYIDLQSDSRRISVVASFAEHVAKLAPSDTVAARICLRAARELTVSVVTALTRVASDPDDEPVVSAVGGVFRSAVIRERFEELLTESVPTVKIEPAHGDGLDGAEQLQRLVERHPLRSLISVASR